MNRSDSVITADLASFSSWARTTPRRRHPVAHGVAADRLLPRDPVMVQLMLFAGLAQLQLGQHEDRVGLVQPAAGDAVFHAQQVGPLCDRLILGDQHLGHPARLKGSQ